MIRTLFVVLAAGLLSLSSCGPDPSSGGGDILDNFLSARVVDDSARPLVGARVALRSSQEILDSSRAWPLAYAQTVTDGDGHFQFDGLPSGDWTVEVQKRGSGVRLDLRFTTHQGIDAGTLVAQPAATMEGRVALPQGAASAWVTLPGLGRGSRTDSLGRFSFDSVVPGPVRIHAIAEGGGVVGTKYVRAFSTSDRVLGVLPLPSQPREIELALDPAKIGLLPKTSVLALPVPLRLDSLLDFSSARGDGSDLRAVKPDGTPLALQFEEWNPDSAKALVWVLLDSVHASTPTNFKLIWGDTSLSKSGPSEVFAQRDGWMGVWHLGASLADATAARTLTDFGTVVSGAAVGEGRLLPKGQSGYLQVADGSTYDAANDLYVEAWIRSDSLGSDHDAVVARGDAGFRLQRAGTGVQISFALRDSLNSTDSVPAFVTAVGVSSFADGALHHVAGMRRGDSLLVYMDGRREGSVFFSGLAANGTKPLQIGRNTSASRSWHGLIDEVRLARTTRSDDWVRLSFEVQNPLGRILSGRKIR